MLTPLDIENKRFTKTLKGYNVDEVDDFLDQLTLEYEKLYKENAEFKQKFEDLEKEIAHYKEVEQSLQKTLMIAQQQADQIIRDAQAQAKESLSGVTKEEFEIRKKTEDLRRNFDVYKAKMEALLISQLELLQDDKNDDE